MFHRFTALFLALILASPACWCGLMHVPSAAPHVKACCASRAKGKDSSREKDCVCSQTVKARELTQAKVKLPEPSIASDPFVSLVVTLLPKPVATTVLPVGNLDNHGPPLRSRALYHLDCSLLI